MGASAASPGEGRAASIPRNVDQSRQDPLRDFSLELGRAVARRYGENSALQEIFGSLFHEPLAAAHQAACKLKGASESPMAWLKVLAGDSVSAAGSNIASAAAENIAAIVSSLLQSSVAAPPGVSLPTFKQVQVPSGFPTPQKPDFSKVGNVVRAIQSFGAIGAREMMTLPARLLAGQAIEAAAVLTPGVRSHAGLGKNVHKRLQEGYLTHTPGLETVVDRRVYGPTFGVYPKPGMTLSEARMFSGRPVFAAMEMAWVTKSFASLLRADVTSVTLRQNWEIKPVGSTVSGILQEAWYRCSFNWVARNLRQQVPAYEMDLQELEPGGEWPAPVMTRIVLPAPAGGQGELVIPFTLPNLPGLVLYAGVSGPTVADAALLIFYLMNQIDKEIKKRGKPILDGLAHAREIIAEAAGWVFAFIIVALVIIVLVIVAVIIFKALAAAAAALAMAAAKLAAAMAALGMAAAAAGLILIIVDKLGSGDPAKDPMTSLDFGPASVTMRASQVPGFISAYEKVMTECYVKLCEVLNQGSGKGAPAGRV